MKKSFIYILGIAATLFTACENISEDERIIDVEGVTAKRVVLLEDYTGQACLNCPNAHEVATELHELYPENLIVVAIHAGAQGIPSTTNGGLKQSEGDVYANSVGVQTYPSGQINRRGGLKNHTAWTAAVVEELGRPSEIVMTLYAELREGKLYVESTMMALDNVKGKLQLWMLEDNIVGMQLLPTGKPDMQYVHNHVFRSSINGTWGEDVELTLGEQLVVEHKDFELNSAWNADNLSVVAFVYNNDGVLQAAQCKVIVNE